MSASTFRRCGCRDDAGKQLGAKCPKLGQKNHGTWGYYVELAPGPDGKRRQHRRAGFPTKKAAEKAAEKVSGRASSGQIVDDRQTVGEFLKAWLEGKRSLRPTTRLSYQSHLDLYLVPLLGRIPLEKLRAADIAEAYRSIEAGAPGRRKVGPTSLRRVHATLSSALSAAVKQQRLTVNPAAFVELPPRLRHRVQPWEPSELGAFLDAIATDRLAALYQLLAFTGLRRGEALGLRWSDIDAERSVLIVRQQLIQVGYRLHFGPPKTASGEHRRVDVDAATMAVLLEHRLRQDMERAEWADAYVDQELVFAKENGEPLHPEFVTRHMQLLAAEAGLRRVRLHDLRHGAASLQLAAGVPVAIVSKTLGHASIGITADLYSHLLEGVGKQAAEAAAALVPRREFRPSEPALNATS